MNWKGDPGLRDQVHRRLLEFAASAKELPLYRAIALAAANDDEVVDLLLVAQPGQQRPVLLLAAIHDLVLQQSASGAPPAVARWYASVVGRGQLPAAHEWASPGPWPQVREFIAMNRAELAATIASRSTQTNEVNRSVYVLALLAAARHGDHPIGLVEFGTSAGLLLTADQYDVRIDQPPSREGTHWGSADSAVRLAGEARGGLPPGLRPPVVAARVGVDVAPIRPADEAPLRWLKACLWPDAAGRVERFEAAVAQRRKLSAAARPTMIPGSMTDPATIRRALDAAQALAGEDAQLVALTSWAMTYVKRDERTILAGELARHSAETGGRVSWCSAEPTGCVPGLPAAADVGGQLRLRPGDTQLGVRAWHAGREETPLTVGSAHPHGQWMELRSHGQGMELRSE